MRHSQGKSEWPLIGLFFFMSASTSAVLEGVLRHWFSLILPGICVILLICSTNHSFWARAVAVFVWDSDGRGSNERVHYAGKRFSLNQLFVKSLDGGRAFTVPRATHFVSGKHQSLFIFITLFAFMPPPNTHTFDKIRKAVCTSESLLGCDKRWKQLGSKPCHSQGTTMQPATVYRNLLSFLLPPKLSSTGKRMANHKLQLKVNFKNKSFRIWSQDQLRNLPAQAQNFHLGSV